MQTTREVCTDFAEVLRIGRALYVFFLSVEYFAEVVLLIFSSLSIAYLFICTIFVLTKRLS